MFKQKRSDFYALEIEENMPIRQDMSVKLWHVETSGRRTASLIAHDSIRTYNDTSARLVLGQYENDFEISKKTVGLVLPRSGYVVRLLDLPKSSPHEMRNMIKLQMGSMLPYDAEDIVFDFMAGDTVIDGKVRVAAFIVTNEVLKQQLSFIEGDGIVPAFIFPATPLILSAYSSHCAQGEGTVSVIVDIDDVSAEVIVARDGALLLSQNSAFVRGKEKAFVDRLFFSIKKLQPEVSAFDVKTIIVNNKAIKEHLNAGCADEFPAALVQCVEHTDQKRVVVADNGSFYDQTRSLALGVGLGLVDDRTAVSLLPDSLRSQKHAGVLHAGYRITIVLLVCLVCAIAGYISVDVYLKKGYMASLKSELMDIKDEATLAQRISATRVIVDESRQKKKLPLFVLSEIYDRVPSTVFLTLCEYSTQEGVRVRGMAQKFSDVSDLVLSLQSSPAFDHVEMKYAKKRVEKTQEFTDFQIDATIDEVFFDVE